MFFNFIFIIGCVRYLLVSQSLKGAIILYTIFLGIFKTIIGIFLGMTFLPILMTIGLSVSMASIYFWLLKKTEGSVIWWLIMVVGLIGLILF